MIRGAMGCETYPIEWHDGKRWRSGSVAFGESAVGCLCSFPDSAGAVLSTEEVRLLAQLGAAVALAKRGDLTDRMIPNALPAWIVRDIDRRLGLQEEE